MKRQFLPLAVQFSERFDVGEILQQFHQFGFDDYSKYDGLKYGKAFQNGLYTRKYLLQNFLDESEFKESNETSVPEGGEAYKLLCMTDYDASVSNQTPDQIPVYKLEDPEKQRKFFEKVKDPSHRNYVPEADERNYTVPNGNLKGIFRTIFESIPGKVCRTRLAVLMPGQEVKTHVDLNTNYAIRLHLPLITSPEVVFGVIGKKARYEFHMPSDGKVWFLNTAYPHYVKNLSSKPRVHMIFSVVGQEILSGKKDVVFLDEPGNEEYETSYNSWKKSLVL